MIQFHGTLPQRRIQKETNNYSELIAFLRLVLEQGGGEVILSQSLENYAVARNDFPSALKICEGRLEFRKKESPHPMSAYKHYAELLRQAGFPDKAVEYDKLVNERPMRPANAKQP